MGTFVLLALAYSLTVPIWEAPDEPGHYDYIATLVSSGFRLPVQVLDQLTEAHQPPLHYALAAALAAPFDVGSQVGRPLPNPGFRYVGQGNDPNLALHGTAETFPFQGYSLAFHVARLVSVFAGAVTVLFTMRIASLLFPRRPWLMVTAGALVGLNPQFLFISGAINNDATVTMAATGTLLQALLVLRQPGATGRWWRLGIWMGLAVLAKPSGAVAALAAGIAIAALAHSRYSRRDLVRHLGRTLFAAITVCGWWFSRNQLLYGDLLGSRVFRQVFWMVQRRSPFILQDLHTMLFTQLRTFWGEFGWLTVVAPGWFHDSIEVLLVISVVSLVSTMLRGDRHWLTDFQKRGLALLGLALFTQQGFQLVMAVQFDPSHYQGRYLFPAIAPVSLFIGLGLQQFVGRRRCLLAPVLVGLAGCALFLCFGVIAPAYPMVPLPRWALFSLPRNTQADLGGQFRLLGQSIRELEHPHRLEVRLYWEAAARPDFDYSAFVHLTDVTGVLLSQDDHGPGADRGYPPTSWLVGDVVRDIHSLPLPEALLPGDYRLRVGLYNWQTGTRLPMYSPPGRELPEATLETPITIGAD